MMSMREDGRDERWRRWSSSMKVVGRDGGKGRGGGGARLRAEEPREEVEDLRLAMRGARCCWWRGLEDASLSESEEGTRGSEESGWMIAVDPS